MEVRHRFDDHEFGAVADPSQHRRGLPLASSGDADLLPTPSADDNVDVRAYMMWASLLNEASIPSIVHLDLQLEDSFATRGVLLKLQSSGEDAVIMHVGGNVRTEFAIDKLSRNVSDVPDSSLIAEIARNCANATNHKSPVRFEATCLNAAGAGVECWGLLLPFSTDGARIDYIYAVTGWSAAAVQSATTPTASDFGVELGEDALILTSDLIVDNMGNALTERLAQARISAKEASEAHGRSRLALYRAIGEAHAFALSARRAPEEYAELLQEAGIVVHPRHPMTALARLVFGIGYDKTRLAEIALLLTHAIDDDIAAGTLADRLLAYPGGLKAWVRALRQSAPPPARHPLRDQLKQRLMTAPRLEEADLAIALGETAILVARRGVDGRVEIIAQLEDSAITERALKLAARKIRHLRSESAG